MPENFYAVISGELAESRKFSQDHIGKIPDTLRATFHDINKHLERQIKLDYEIIRMDEFLCITDNPASSIRSLIMLASAFRLKAYNELNIRADLRLSVGIGPAEFLKKEIRESDGTAFQYAVHGLHSMKRHQRLQITTADERINREFIVECGFMDILIHDWSDEQAEALMMSLSGKTQTDISEVLRISQPAVNRRLKSAHAEAIGKFIERFEYVLTNNIQKQ